MLKIEDLSLSFGESRVFCEGNLNRSEGEILVVTGCSGSGKSSLVKCINGIIPNVDNGKISGKMILDGDDLLEKSIEERSRYLSTVFQNPKTQFFCVESCDEIAFGLENRNVPRDEIIRIMDETTKRLETEHLAGRNLFTLSGGEKQLVAITATACMDNGIYLFDEPTSSLDGKMVKWLKNTILKLKNQGKTVIVAEHRLYFLMDILDRLCIIEDGKFHVFESEEVERLGESLRNRFNLRSLKEKITDDVTKVNMTGGSGDGSIPEEGLYCKGFICTFGKKKIMDMDIHFTRGINFITGENGVGKSTFIRKLTGIMKGKGRIFFDGKKVRRSCEYMTAVMQDVSCQLFTDSVIDELMVGSDNINEAKSLLSRFGLLEKMDMHPQVLSGGEKQRLLIARAFILGKPVIIFDEPTSGLCKGQMENICSCLKELEKQGKIVIVVTHDFELINNCSGRVYQFVRE